MPHGVEGPPELRCHDELPETVAHNGEPGSRSEIELYSEVYEKRDEIFVVKVEQLIGDVGFGAPEELSDKHVTEIARECGSVFAQAYREACQEMGLDPLEKLPLVLDDELQQQQNVRLTLLWMLARQGRGE